MFILITRSFSHPIIWLVIAIHCASYILNEQHASADESYMCHFYAVLWKEAGPQGANSKD